MNHKWLSFILLLIALTHYSWGEELRDTWTLSNEEATEAYDEQGDKVWSRQLNIYGETRRESGEKNFIPFLYQGQYFDEETELAYNRYRYYSPETGLYVSQDPIGIDANQPNFYAYVEDVNRWLDPYGLSCSAAKNKKTVYNGSSRRDAFRQAKRDANVPMSQKPTKIEKPVLEDGYGKPVMKDGQPVTFRVSF